jgi:hypothetical protein
VCILLVQCCCNNKSHRTTLPPLHFLRLLVLSAGNQPVRDVPLGASLNQPVTPALHGLLRINPCRVPLCVLTFREEVASVPIAASLTLRGKEIFLEKERGAEKEIGERERADTALIRRGEKEKEIGIRQGGKEIGKRRRLAGIFELGDVAMEIDVIFLMRKAKGKVMQVGNVSIFPKGTASGGIVADSSTTQWEEQQLTPVSLLFRPFRSHERPQPERVYQQRLQKTGTGPRRPSCLNERWFICSR